MEETKEKETAYVICSKTLKELQDIVKDMDRWASETIYEYNVDRSDMSEEQKLIQTQNKWYREQTQEFRIYDEKIYEMVKKLATEKILGGCKKYIKKEVYEAVYNTDLRAIGWIVEHGGHSSLNTNIEFGEEDKVNFEYSTDMKEFEEKLKDVKTSSPYSSTRDEYILLEKINVSVRPYQFSEIDKTIKKQINKFIKNELTYCLKNDEVIIPQEYLDKGEAGIKEWRDIKASKNKNNSIEKKILRQEISNKKECAYNNMCKVMDTIDNSTNVSWVIPFITVDGRWNKQRTTKLVNQILDSKTQQFYIDITEEEMLEKFKKYWKDVLMDAYKSVDKLTIEESK